jgi:DnaJ-class molecular chaperone
VTQTLTNPYRVLGVGEKASLEEIKAAYRRLALQYHPDRNPGDKEAEEQFKKISEAYATLRDPQSRTRYDRYGGYGPGGTNVQPDFSTVDWQAIFQEADIHLSGERWATMPPGGNPMFQALFGVMAGLMRNSGMLPGEDREVAVALSLEQARRGIKRRVRIPGPSICAGCRGQGRLAEAECPRCQGEGVVRSGSEVDVSVPAGIAPGARLRLKGLGGPGNPPGDAYVRVGVSLPAGAQLVGTSLHAELSLLPHEAKRGTRTTIFGAEVLVPPGSKEGDVIVLAKLGPAGGDLVLRLRVGVLPGLYHKLRQALADS